MMFNLPCKTCSLILILLLSGACGKPESDNTQRLSGEDLVRHNRAVGLMGQYQYDAALAELAALVGNYPDNSDLRIDWSIATLNRQQQGDEAKALAELEDVLKKSANNLRAHYISGLLKLNAGELAQATPHFEQVVTADPGDAYASYYLALSLAQQGLYQAALARYERTIDLDPYLLSAYYGAFQTLRKLGNDERAREMLGQYEKMATNPRSRQAEYKYTRMGPKAEIRALNYGEPEIAAFPSGPLFQGPTALLENLQPDSSQQRPNLTTADINSDGYLDLLIAGSNPGSATPNSILLGKADGGFVLAEDHFLTHIPGINAALWADIDNDGLVDLYLCRNGANQHWRQTEHGRWEDISHEITANGNWNTRDGALFDADHDGDLDIFLINADGPNELLNNNLNGTFRALAAEQGLQGRGPGSQSVILADLDRDRDTDIVVINAQGGHEVYLNELLWNYRQAPGFDDFKSSPATAAVAQDRDADGIPELYTLSADGQVRMWQPDAQKVWQATVFKQDRDGRPAADPRMAMLDINGDGSTELLRSIDTGWSVSQIQNGQLTQISTADQTDLLNWIPVNHQVSAGPAIVGITQSGQLFHWPPGQGRHEFAGLQFSGMDAEEHSMRSNASGIGTYAAIRVTDRWTVIHAFRQSSGPGQSLQPYSVGLGGAARADFIMLEWSDGVYQTELNVAAGELHRISETQRQLASCPVLFAWDGQTYRFVSDILGVGGLGFAIGRGEYSVPRPRENFQLPEGLLKPRHGSFRFSFSEPMEETAYLDQARLSAYDLPPGWQLVLDERMAILGPQASGKPVFFRTERLPSRAVNDRQQDVTAYILEADHQAAPAGELDPRFIGLLKQEHSLILEFDEPLDKNVGEPTLVIDGWIEYPYSQTMFAAWQAGVPYQAPSLDIPGKNGQWRTLLEQFGYPAGMPRRMSVPLGKLPDGVTRLRLRTNQEIYWDRIAIVYAETPPRMEHHNFPLESAGLRANGFPLRTTGEQRLPHYDYDRSPPFWDTRHMAGFYTEFGDATDLVEARDDAVAIIGPGEEVNIAFRDDAGQVREGWTRIYVFESFGWAKDMDMYTLDGSTVGPLPTSGKDGVKRDQLHGKYNTRYRSGN
jgi:tetratricopeptide (TPR) repeat protein